MTGMSHLFPGYQPIIESFGEKILGQDGQIDRSRLYEYVRSDHQARGQLLSIINPLVKQATISLIRQTEQSVVFIMATKLSGFGLLELCDRVWVITAPIEVQVSNLVWKRGWTNEQARNYVQISNSKTTKSPSNSSMRCRYSLCVKRNSLRIGACYGFITKPPNQTDDH